MYLSLLYQGQPVKQALLFTAVEEIWEYVFNHLEEFDSGLARQRLHLSLIHMNVSHHDGGSIDFKVRDDRTEKLVDFPDEFSVRYMQHYYVYKGKQNKKTTKQLLD